LKSIIGRSTITFSGLHFATLQAAGGFIPSSRKQIYQEKFKNLRKEIIDALGENGVFFYPTYNEPAFTHYDSVWNIGNTSYCAIINILGFPSTHVPCGKDQNGLPIGFQVIAAPFQDRLCFAMAAELEAAFGGFKFY
jgi:fatty acid amide hydrolase 2